MKYTIIIIALSASLIWACQDKQASQTAKEIEMSHEMDHKMDQDHSAMHSDHTVAYYTCPMESHKHVHASEPGDCPECGMKLVAAVETTPENADFFGCPMPEHSHVRADEPGSCPECGMNLKPYKLQDSDL